MMPIAVRASAVPVGWKLRRRRRQRGSWPRSAFLLTTVARPSPGEQLWFGACALLPSLLPGQRPVDVRLFVADDCAADDKAVIAAVAARHGWQEPVTRAELVKLFRRRVYKQGLPLVSFGIPVQVARVAAGWRAGRSGGFSLVLASRPCPPGARAPTERRRRPLLQNGEIEAGDCPRVAVKPLEGLRAATRFQGRGRPDDVDRAPEGLGGRLRRHYVFPGHFVDLATLAWVHAGGKRFASVADAAAAFDMATAPAVADGGDLPALVEVTVSELAAMAGLYVRLLACHAETPGGDRVSPDQVYSPASYAEGLFETVGLDLPLANSDLPGYAHAQGMGAFFGGDCGIATRHVDVPVAYLDISGHYPVSAHLAGTFDLLRATKRDLIGEDPAELQEFLASVTVERLLSDRVLWRRLARTVCMVRPRGDVLPHRVPNGTGLLLKVAPLWSEEPLPYMLADLAAGVLRTGLLPEIESAFSIRPRSHHRKRLRPMRMPSGYTFDPRRDDLLLVLAEERMRLENDLTIAPAERKRRAKVLKLMVNAACYGLLCQVNVQPVAGEMEVTAWDGSTRTIPVEALEEPGRWMMPLLASGVTATGRLLLGLARVMVERAGGAVCSWDTDSLCVPVTRDGGLIPCPDGPYRDTHGAPAIPALSFAQLAQVQAELERLSPYDPALKPTPDTPLLLGLEPENLDERGRRVDLHLYATASKNYDLHARDREGALTLRKHSEHGLGHLRTPGHPELDERDWILEGRHHLLANRLGITSVQPSFWPEPAISVITLNRPSELARLHALLADRSDTTRLCPFSRLAVAHPTAQYARDSDGKRRTPVAPFHAGFTLGQARWFDLSRGTLLTPRWSDSNDLAEADVAAIVPGRVLCDSVGRALERNSRRREAKAVDRRGNPCSRTTIGVVEPASTEAIRVIPIGKEARNLERAGITEDPAHTLYTDPDLDAWRKTFLLTLHALAPGRIPRGRPSRHERARLAHHAAELARAELQREEPHAALPDDPEAVCYLYLKRRTRPQLCACGCGHPAIGRSRYAGPAHRTRAYRARIAAGEIA